MSCTPPRPAVSRNRCSMGRRPPWARRLLSPCRTGEPSAAAQVGDPTRPDELTDIAGKPAARAGSPDQARSTRCSCLPPWVSRSSACWRPLRRRMQLQRCTHRGRGAGWPAAKICDRSGHMSAQSAVGASCVLWSASRGCSRPRRQVLSVLLDYVVLYHHSDYLGEMGRLIVLIGEDLWWVSKWGYNHTLFLK